MRRLLTVADTMPQRFSRHTTLDRKRGNAQRPGAPRRTGDGLARRHIESAQVEQGGVAAQLVWQERRFGILQHGPRHQCAPHGGTGKSFRPLPRSRSKADVKASSERW